MWKKTLLALGLAGLLALPVGAALAIDDDDVTGDQPLVTVDQDRDQVRDPAECGNCPGSENPAPAMTGDRDRDRMRIQDPDETAIQERDQTRLQERDQTRVQDPDHTAIQEREQTRLQEREQTRLQDREQTRLQVQVRTQTHVQNQATHQAGTDSAGSNRNGEGNRQGQDG